MLSRKTNALVFGGLLGLLTFLLIILALILLLMHFSSENDLTLDEINRVMGAPIPQDAIHLHYTGWHAGPYITLDFEAPPQSMSNFLKPLCGGVIFAGYDPYAAIDIGEPFSYTHVIDVGEYPYYSYSSNTPDTIKGNRCGNKQGGWLQVRVDTANPQLYAIKVDVAFSCEMCKNIPVRIVMPIADFPVQVLGLQAVQKGFILEGDEACIGMLTLDYTSKQKWVGLIDAQVRVMVDSDMVDSARIGQQGQLVNESGSNHHSVRGGDGGFSTYLCFAVNQTKGTHTMGIEVKTISGKNYSYSWAFEITESPTNLS